MSDVIENNERKSHNNIKACLSMTFYLGMPCKGEKAARWIFFSFFFGQRVGGGSCLKLQLKNKKHMKIRHLKDNMNTYEEKFMFAPYHLNKKTFQVWLLSPTQPLNCGSKIWLNPLIHLPFAVLEEYLNELWSWLDIIVLHIFICHDLHNWNNTQTLSARAEERSKKVI